MIWIGRRRSDIGLLEPMDGVVNVHYVIFDTLDHRIEWHIPRRAAIGPLGSMNFGRGGHGGKI